MRHKIGEEVELFKTKERRKIINVIEAQVDIWGNTVDMYVLEGESGLFVDIHDGTVGKA